TKLPLDTPKQLKMKVNWRHLKNSLSSKFKGDTWKKRCGIYDNIIQDKQKQCPRLVQHHRNSR
ncbi:hypothetical protein KYX90_13575, partial [Enterococcus lactis]|nr:hypothetical protein [Enterococcus lactis]